MDFVTDGLALDSKIRFVLTAYFSGANLNNSSKYNFRCNICNDSKKSKTKKRGWILKDRSPWMFFCFNCGHKQTAVSWLKEYFPLQYKEYIKEILKPKSEQKKIVVKPVEEKKPKPNNEEREAVKYFILIKKGTGELFDCAIELCKKRMIPEEIWEKWFVAIDGKYRNRLIIPFYDDKGKCYNYQARSLIKGLEPKYISRVGNHNSIYHYYTVDRNKPVPVLEGMIDSDFVENSIAMTGLKMDDKRLDDFPKKYYLLDDDEEGRKRSIKLLKNGEYVFCWDKFRKDNNLPKRSKWDINEVIIYMKRDKFTFDELKPYFTNSTYDEVLFL